MESKIGLALGSGGARGLAHIGVLKVFDEAGIPIHCIAGCSMGALIGSLYSLGFTPMDMEKMATKFQRNYFLDFTIPKMGLINGDKIKQLIKILSKGKQMEHLQPKMAVVATDLCKGEKVVFSSGDISTAVRASISIPGIFVPEIVGDRQLVDGAVVDRVPVAELEEMGAEIIIAVDVSYFESKSHINSIFDVILQSMDIMEKVSIRQHQIKSDMIIKPIIKQYSSTSFKHIESIIKHGEDETRKKLPQILDLINSRKGK